MRGSGMDETMRAWVAGSLVAVWLSIGFGFSFAQNDPAAAEADRADESGLLSEPTPAADGGPGFVAEVLDSTFAVGPAEFLALDLPRRSGDAVATHLFGTVTVVGSGRKDIIVRLFRSDHYANWLKKRAAVPSEPFFHSGRARDITLDQDLPPGEPVVLLLDNGYSVRTPKRVRVQLQVRFGEGAAIAPASGAATGESAGAGRETEEYDDVLPVPRSNEEEYVPPPPPPPPDEE